MKQGKRVFALLMMLCLLASLSATVFAAPSDMCTIRIFSGAQGTIGGATVKTYQIERGTRFEEIGSSISGYATEKTGSKYYVKGLRESGKEENHDLSFTVEKDEDFVVTYGIRHNEVKYYVQYVSTTGTVLHARSGPFTANYGDTVYVAYIEIDGYTPDAYNRTGTLTSASRLLQADGTYLFTFTYRQNPTPTTPTTGGGGAAAAAAQGAAAGAGAGAGAAAGANANANNPNANANGNANNQNANNQNANNQNANGANTNAGANTAPLEVIDEDQVPLAVPDFGTSGSAAIPNAPKVIEPNQRSRLPNWAIILTAVVLVGLIAMLYWYLLFYRKKKKYASVDEDYEILGFDDDDKF